MKALEKEGEGTGHIQDKGTAAAAALPFSPNGLFHRYRHVLRTWAVFIIAFHFLSSLVACVSGVRYGAGLSLGHGLLTLVCMCTCAHIYNCTTKKTYTQARALFFITGAFQMLFYLNFMRGKDHVPPIYFYLDVAISLYTATPQYFIALAGAPLPVSVLFVGLHVAVVARFNYFINLPWPLFRALGAQLLSLCATLHLHKKARAAFSSSEYSNSSISNNQSGEQKASCSKGCSEELQHQEEASVLPARASSPCSDSGIISCSGALMRNRMEVSTLPSSNECSRRPGVQEGAYHQSILRREQARESLRKLQPARDCERHAVTGEAGASSPPAFLWNSGSDQPLVLQTLGSYTSSGDLSTDSGNNNSCQSTQVTTRDQQLAPQLSEPHKESIPTLQRILDQQRRLGSAAFTSTSTQPCMIYRSKLASAGCSPRMPLKNNNLPGMTCRYAITIMGTLQLGRVSPMALQQLREEIYRIQHAMPAETCIRAGCVVISFSLPNMEGFGESDLEEACRRIELDAMEWAEEWGLVEAKSVSGGQQSGDPLVTCQACTISWPDPCAKESRTQDKHGCSISFLPFLLPSASLMPLSQSAAATDQQQHEGEGEQAYAILEAVIDVPAQLSLRGWQGPEDAPEEERETSVCLLASILGCFLPVQLVRSSCRDGSTTQRIIQAQIQLPPILSDAMRSSTCGVPVVLELWTAGRLSSSSCAMLFPPAHAPAVEDLRTWMSMLNGGEGFSSQMREVVHDLVAWVHYRYACTYPEDQGGETAVSQPEELQLMADVGRDLLCFSEQQGMAGLAEMLRDGLEASPFCPSYPATSKLLSLRKESLGKESVYSKESYAKTSTGSTWTCDTSDAVS